MKNTVTIFRNALDPADRKTEHVDDVCEYLTTQFVKWPDTAKLYFRRIDATNDVTPHGEADIERIGSMTGHFFVVVWPEDPITIGIIVAIAIAAVAIGLAFVLRPTTKSSQESSPNNELGARQNKARPNERIPDIEGTVRSTPDLLALPYKAFVNNKEFEYCYLCIGRGSYTIIDCKDDQTPVAEIDGEYVAVYPPGNSPNSAVPAPQVVFGTPPTTIPVVVSVQQSNAVNGQVVRAPNSGRITTNNNIAFGFGGTILTNDSSLDFTEYFVPSITGSDSFLTIYTNDDGLNASDPSEHVHSVGLAGTYKILSVTSSEIVLSNPAAVNPNWNILATFSGQQSTFYHTFLITTDGGDAVADGPFILNVANLDEVWANFVAQNGLYYIDSSGNQKALTVTIQISAQALDSALSPTGDIITGTVNIVGSARERLMCGATLKLKLPHRGPVQVTVKRITPMGTTKGNSYSQDIQWRDLYSVSYVGNAPIETVQSALGIGALVGAFTDGSGHVIQTLAVGRGATYKVPAGATQLQLGIDDDKFNDNSGSFNVTATSGVNTWTGTVDGKAMPWNSGSNPSFAYGISDGSAPVVALTGLTTGDTVVVKANSGTVTVFSGFGPHDAGGDAAIPTVSNTGTTGTLFPTAYMTTQAGTPSNIDFGNVTTVLAITAQTPDALSIKSRKINLLVTRNLPTWINRGTTPPQFSTTLHPTNNAADIFCAMALDPYIGRRQLKEIDVAGIYAVADSAYMGGEHTNGQVASYFGTFLMTEFCYTFDDSKISFEESTSYIAQALNCIAYRSASVINLSFEKQTPNSTILYNHRNKLPKSETRTTTFGTLNDNDGVSYDYVDPNAPNYPAVDTTLTLFYPADQSAVNPKKVQSIGVRNRVQATINGWRLFQKIKNANVQTEFEATQEANLSILSDRVLVADNTRTKVMDGEIRDQSGLTVTTSQPNSLTGGTFVDDNALWSTPTGGIAWTRSRPLGQTIASVLWRNFRIPSMPTDAVVTAIVPVLVAGATRDIADSYYGYGQNLTFNDFVHESRFATPFAPENQSFGSTQFHAASIGTDLTLLADACIQITLNSSLVQDVVVDTIGASFIGYAIYYTSATPVTETRTTPPIAVPAGQGLAFALGLSVESSGTQAGGTGLLDPGSFSATGTPTIYSGTAGYTIFLQLYDGTVESMGAFGTADPFQLVLQTATRLPLTVDGKNFARATYILVPNDGSEIKLPFLVTQKEPQDNNTYKVTAINYSDTYYSHDTDFTGGIILAPSVGYGPQGYIGEGNTAADGTTSTTGTGGYNGGDYSGSGTDSGNNPSPPVTTPPVDNPTPNEGDNIAENEVPVGTIDGDGISTGNAVFTLLHSPSPQSSLKLYLNGLRQYIDVHFTLIDNVITFFNAPEAGLGGLIADYRY